VTAGIAYPLRIRYRSIGPGLCRSLVKTSVACPLRIRYLSIGPGLCRSLVIAGVAYQSLLLLDWPEGCTAAPTERDPAHYTPGYIAQYYWPRSIQECTGSTTYSSCTCKGRGGGVRRRWGYRSGRKAWSPYFSTRYFAPNTTQQLASTYMRRTRITCSIIWFCNSPISDSTNKVLMEISR
jgi:hypothetical protein